MQRYFIHVLKEEQPYISCVRITHDGLFKTGIKKDWINIKGEQYATTEKPGFIWKGTTSIFTARDMFIADLGRLVVSLFSLYNVVDAKGEQYNQGELVRWLSDRFNQGFLHRGWHISLNLAYSPFRDLSPNFFLNALEKFLKLSYTVNPKGVRL